MPERAQRATPPHPTAVRITPLSLGTMLRVKCWLPDPANGRKPVAIAGQKWPSQVGAVLPGPARVLCVGPGEWLVVSRHPSSSDLRERLEPEATQLDLTLVDLSEGLVSLEVKGFATHDLLSKGCGLDIHPHSFPAGRCARTRFAQIPIVIECLDGPLRFELHAARSYWYYLWAWLDDAAIEFENSST